MENVIIATIKSWNIENAEHLKHKLIDNYKIFVITSNEQLNYKKLCAINPKYIFFPHWSWIIPEEIYNNFECIVFHMTDLPYGRGGSPLQNLIVRNQTNTKISAIRVEQGLDTGKVYLKRDFYIGLGSAEEIFLKASDIIFFDMIPYILKNKPVPVEQEGEVVLFSRRKPEQSDILKAEISDINTMYNFIRMLDGEGYPNAFFKVGKLKFLFSEVHMKQNKLVGRFEVVCDE
jgi:methionyl-tRNA formyltransferase